ncbi:MAG: CHASE2 domain-containing protein [Candidatus Omnitrophica bacterium]|nr:CHASE2 domain-containing protein [Candidatus Omnitrophota bacterium]MDD5488882.1 CHASE2 domain-containing protein [Candidatus Omnitrophota bacterium]
MTLRLNRVFILNITLALIIASVFVGFSSNDFFRRVESYGLDFLFRVRGPLECNPKIIIIEVDDNNISKVGRWPWPRRWHAVLVKALKDMGAKYIYFDIIFSESAPPGEDEVFAQAIKESGNVYLPFAFRERSVDIDSALTPVNALYSNTRGTGAINIYPDIDGAIRSIPLLFKDRGVLYPHITLKLAADISGQEIRGMEDRKIILEKDGTSESIPLTGDGRMIINWLGSWKDTFKHFSFLQVLDVYNSQRNGVKSKIDAGEFKDSICLIAITATGLYDIKPTPVDPEYPGIGIVANIINDILARKFITPAPDRMNWALVYVLTLVPFLFITGEKPLREILSVILIGIFFLVIVVYLFKRSYWVEFTMPMISLFSCYLAVESFHFVRVSIERQKFLVLASTDELTGLSNMRFFRIVLDAECTISKSNPKQQFCLIMCDIDHFKNFNDTYGHAAGDRVLTRTAEVLRNSVRVSDVLARYGGEEFVVMLRGASLRKGLEIGEKIRKNVEENIIAGDEGELYKTTISVGVASFCMTDNGKTLLERSDKGLYKAKGTGRNCVATVQETDIQAERQ